MNVKLGIELFQWQKDVLSNLLQNWKGSVHTIVSRRQCGKSILLEVILLHTAIQRPKTTSFLVCPTLEQSLKQFKEIKDAVIGTKLYKSHNEVRQQLELVNGSKIICKSVASGDNLRGFTCTGILCCDECAYWYEEIFYTILPWTNVSQCPIILTSTPNGKSGFFYEYYQRGLENNNRCYSYKWSDEYYDMSALLPPEKLEEYRKTLPPNKFKTEYMAEFLSNESSVFGDYSACISDEPIDYENVILSVDWGTGGGKDYTAVTILSTDCKVVEIVAFNDRDELQTINTIINLINKYKPLKVVVEENSIGKVFYGLLDKAIKANSYKPYLVRFLTTNASKERIINNLQVRIQNKEITFPNDKRLLIQLDNYELKINSNNTHIYNAASGFNDDILMSLMIGVDSLSRGSYALR